MSLHVLAYNLKRAMQLIGIRPLTALRLFGSIPRTSALERSFASSYKRIWPLSVNAVKAVHELPQRSTPILKERVVH